MVTAEEGSWAVKVQNDIAPRALLCVGDWYVMARNIKSHLSRSISRPCRHEPHVHFFSQKPGRFKGLVREVFGSNQLRDHGIMGPTSRHRHSVSNSPARVGTRGRVLLHIGFEGRARGFARSSKRRHKLTAIPPGRRRIAIAFSPTRGALHRIDRGLSKVPNVRARRATA